MAASAAVLLVGGLAGCTALFHKPRPDLDLSVEQRPWRVRCGYVLGASEEPGASRGPRGDGSAWARDTHGRRLVLDGEVVDGFFVVAAVRAASDEDERDAPAYPATLKDARRACAISLDLAIEGEQPELAVMAAAREGEGIDVPIVFPADPALPRPVSRMVVFGDSLSDPGNLKRRLLVFPNSPYWFGRFSNGPNWTEHFSHRTGMAVQNEAFGGAVAVRHDDVPTAGIVASIEQGVQFFLTGSIERQVTDYLSLDVTGGKVRDADEVVFVLWGGANDYISKEPFTGEIGTLLDDPRGKAGYVHVVDEAVASIADQVRRLHAAGGRRFVVLNLPDLGRTPIVLQNSSYPALDADRTEAERQLRLSSRLGELSAYHNRQLARAVSSLHRENPEAVVIQVDTARLLERILSGTAPDGSGRSFDYGFSLPELRENLRAGGRTVAIQDRCYRGGYLGSLNDHGICELPGSAVFWDVVHPTSYTHCWVAYFVQKEMAARGLVANPVSMFEHRALCTVRAQAAS